MDEVSKRDIYLKIRRAVSDEDWDWGAEGLIEVAEMYWEYSDIIVAGLIADKARIMVWK